MTNRLLSEVKEPLRLWIVVSPGADTEAIMKSYWRCNESLTGLLDGKVSFEEYLDTLDSEGVAMDDYLETAEDNLSQEGLI